MERSPPFTHRIIVVADGAAVDEPRTCAMPLAIIVDDRVDVRFPAHTILLVSEHLHLHHACRC